MSIKPPEWFPNAIPTYDGWINPENKELLVRSPAGGFSEEVIMSQDLSVEPSLTTQIVIGPS